MAVQLYNRDRLTAIELGWKLKEKGYDLEKLEELSKMMGVDLLEILAGWAPILVDVLKPNRRSLWRRIWRKS